MSIQFKKSLAKIFTLSTGNRPTVYITHGVPYIMQPYSRFSFLAEHFLRIPELIKLHHL